MNDKKSLLILCDSFAPPAYLPRIINLCKNLQNVGWDVYVITEKTQDADFSTDVCSIVQIPYYTRHGLVGKIEWALKVAADCCLGYKDNYFLRKLRPYLNGKQFDLLLCSTFSQFPLTCACKLAKQLQIPLVADVRDIAEQGFGDNTLRHRLPYMFGVGPMLQKLHICQCIRKRNAALRKANAVITVSPWHQQFLAAIQPNTHLIYNGFDEEAFTPKDKKNDHFSIVYTGRLYSQQYQNPQYFFQALHEIDQATPLDPKEFEVRWYVNDSTKFRVFHLAEYYKVSHLMRYNSYMPVSEMPHVLHDSSIVLVFANKSDSKGPQGVMTTKFFEALGVEKPVLCVRSDEGCLAQAIAETNAGISASTLDEVKQFILEKQAEWKQNGFTRQAVNAQAKQKFSRQKQAEQFIEIFNSLI